MNTKMTEVSKKPATVLVALFLGIMCTGSTCTGRQVANTALDVAEMSCLFFHDDIEDEATLAKICQISEALIPEVRKIIFARKDAMKMKAKAAASASASGK